MLWVHVEYKQKKWMYTGNFFASNNGKRKKICFEFCIFCHYFLKENFTFSVAAMLQHPANQPESTPDNKSPLPSLRSTSSTSSSSQRPKTLRLASSSSQELKLSSLNPSTLNHPSTISVLSIDVQDADELNQEVAHCGKCYSFSKCLFGTTSIHAFPFGSGLALGCSLIGMWFQFDGWYVGSSVIHKYNPEAWFYIWIFGILAALILLIVNSTVFIYGITSFWMACSSKISTTHIICCCCCCCDCNPQCGDKQRLSKRASFCDKFIHRCGSCCSITGQISISVFGAIGIWIVYLAALAVTFVSALCVGLSWLLEQSCSTFQTLVKRYIDLAKKYLARAKVVIAQNSERAKDLLREFEQIRDLTLMFQNSALGEVVKGFGATGVAQTLTQQFDGGGGEVAAAGTASAAAGSAAAASAASSGMPGSSFPRRFLMSNIDPEAMLAQGIGALDIVNQTIVNVEHQVLYYENVGSIMTEFCFDAASLYDAVFWVTIGAFVVSVAQMIMFASHVKQYTAWSYEVDLIRALEHDQLEMHVDEENEENEEKLDNERENDDELVEEERMRRKEEKEDRKEKNQRRKGGESGWVELAVQGS